jgi:serine/threonine protein kinase
MDKGSLDRLLHNKKILNFEAKIKILSDIAHGMKFLHEKGIMHRDLKPQNVLVDKDNICKICDFGLAKVMDETLTVGVIGTWQYMAPEIMMETETYNEKCDVYSFGIMMHEIFTLSKPYGSSASEYVNQFTIGFKILNGLRPNIPSELWNSEISDENFSNMINYFYESNKIPTSTAKRNDKVLIIFKRYFDLCTACWTSKSSDRPTFDQIIFKLQEIENILL